MSRTMLFSMAAVVGLAFSGSAQAVDYWRPSNTPSRYDHWDNNRFDHDRWDNHNWNSNNSSHYVPVAPARYRTTYVPAYTPRYTPTYNSGWGASLYLPGVGVSAWNTPVRPYTPAYSNGLGSCR